MFKINTPDPVQPMPRRPSLNEVLVLEHRSENKRVLVFKSPCCCEHTYLFVDGRSNTYLNSDSWERFVPMHYKNPQYYPLSQMEVTFNA